MTLPANVRVNIGAPFPSIVKGLGAISIQKQNGIWTVGIQIIGLNPLPASANPTQVYLLVYNNATKTFQNMTLSALTSTTPPTTTITNVNSPYQPLATDTFLLVDTTGGAVEVDLPLAATRNAVPLSIKDYKGNAAVNNITIKPSGAETIDGYTNAAPLVLKTNYDGVRLLPIAGGYTIAP